MFIYIMKKILKRLLNVYRAILILILTFNTLSSSSFPRFMHVLLYFIFLCCYEIIFLSPSILPTKLTIRKFRYQKLTLFLISIIHFEYSCKIIIFTAITIHILIIHQSFRNFNFYINFYD